MRISMSVLWLSLSLTVFGQGPISDLLVVTLPNTTWVGSQSLPPGKYTIRQLPTASNPRLLEFSSDDGTKLEAAITTIAALENNGRRETSVTLRQKDGQAHLTHVWIAGKTYGYELPVDESKELATTAEKVTLAANYTPAAQEVAQVAPKPAEPPAAAPVPAPQPAPEPAPVAQAQPEPAPAPAPPPQAAPAPEPAPPQAAMNAQTPAMPQTASHWMELLLAGSVLITLGLFLAHGRLRHS